MNKAELVAQLAEQSNVTKTQAATVLDAFIDTVTKELKKDETVTLVGFGTFSLRKRPARQGRNPRTGETIKIKASKLPSFKAGKGLKDAM